MGKIPKKPWYKTAWKRDLIAIGVTLIVGIPTYILLFKPQKVVIDKPTNDLKIEPKPNDLKIEPKPVEPLIETVPSSKTTSLRKLKPLETGKHLNEIPDNIYGFVHAVAFSRKMPENKEFITLSNERQIESYFEVQKFNNEYYLVGFIGDESYANIGKVNKYNTLELTLFALPWENFKNIVAIPFNAIINIKYREINIGIRHSVSVLDVVTNNIITNIQGHDLNIK
jgi:hypothetical protein